MAPRAIVTQLRWRSASSSRSRDNSISEAIVLNASRIAVTRDKMESKLYIRHSGYPQGLKQETLGQLLSGLQSALSLGNLSFALVYEELGRADSSVRGFDPTVTPPIILPHKLP